MKQSKDYKRVVAIQERSAGNDSVGDMWLDTKTFDKSTKVEDIIEWAKSCSGKLIITIDEDTIPQKPF